MVNGLISEGSRVLGNLAWIAGEHYMEHTTARYARALCPLVALAEPTSNLA
jgi:hypothetical protein